MPDSKKKIHHAHTQQVEAVSNIVYAVQMPATFSVCGLCTLLMTISKIASDTTSGPQA